MPFFQIRNSNPASNLKVHTTLLSRTRWMNTNPDGVYSVAVVKRIWGFHCGCMPLSTTRTGPNVDYRKRRTAETWCACVAKDDTCLLLTAVSLMNVPECILRMPLVVLAPLRRQATRSCQPAVLRLVASVAPLTVSFTCRNFLVFARPRH